MKHLSYIKIKIFLFSLFFIFCFMFMTTSLQILSSDYGVYYANAMFLDKNYSLYSDAFDHKGPVFYIFIKLIGLLFGWGGYSTFIPLFFSFFIFLLSFLFFLETLRLNKYKIFILSVASIACIFDQSGNGSMSFFVNSLILLYLSYLIKFIDSKKFYYFIISAIFLTLAILTRIDAIIFSILIIFHLFLFPKTFQERFLSLVVIFFAFTIIFNIVSTYFDFSIDKYIKTNFIFNFLYPSKVDAHYLSHFHKPESLKILFASGIGVLLFILLNEFLPKMKKFSKRIYGKSREEKFFLSLITSVIFFVVFLIPKTEQSHYVLNLSVSSLILSAILINFIDFKKVLVIPLFAIFFYSILTHTLLPTIKFFKTFGCIESLSCPSFSSIKDTMQDVSNYQNAIIIYGNGWINIFSDTAPALSISNWPIFEENQIGNYFRTITDSNKFLVKKDQILWVDKAIYKKFEKYVGKSNYKIISAQKSYFKIEIN